MLLPSIKPKSENAKKNIKFYHMRKRIALVENIF